MELHERLTGQTFQLNDFLLRKRMDRRQCNHEVIRVNHFFVKFGTAVWRQRARESQINPTVVKSRELLVGVQLIEAQFHIRKIAPKVCTSMGRIGAEAVPKKPMPKAPTSPRAARCANRCASAERRRISLRLPQETLFAAVSWTRRFVRSNNFTPIPLQDESSFSAKRLGLRQRARSLGIKVSSHRGEVSEMAKFQQYPKTIIVKYDYYKQIIRFTRFRKLCDGKSVNGTSPVTKNELKYKRERQRMKTSFER